MTLAYALEIPLSFAFGILTDVYDFLIPEFSLPIVLRCLLFCLTMAVTAMGVYLCVKTDLVLTPTDGIVKTISEVFHIVFSKVKNVFDISLVVHHRCSLPGQSYAVLRHRSRNGIVGDLHRTDHPDYMSSICRSPFLRVLISLRRGEKTAGYDSLFQDRLFFV